jgi:hypothetical protein
VTTDPAGGSFAEKLDASAGPLKRMGAITAQIALSTIPAEFPYTDAEREMMRP